MLDHTYIPFLFSPVLSQRFIVNTNFLIPIIITIFQQPATLPSHDPLHLGPGPGLVEIIQLHRSALPGGDEKHLPVQAVPPVRRAELRPGQSVTTAKAGEREVVRQVQLQEAWVLAQGHERLRQREAVVRDRGAHEAHAGAHEEARRARARQEA